MAEKSTTSTKAKLFLLVCFLGAVGITYWGLAYNRGFIAVDSRVVPFVVSGAYDDDYECKTSPCILELKPKIYTLLLKADTYTPDKHSVTLKRNKTEQITFSPIKTPIITPVELKSDANLRDYYYDRISADGTLEVWLRSVHGDKLLTRLPKENIIDKISYFPGHPYALIWLNDGTVLEIHVPSTRKRTITVNKDWLDLKVLGDSYIAWQNSTGVYYAPYDLDVIEGEKLPINSLNQVVSLSERSLLLLGANSDETEAISVLDIINTDTNLITGGALSIYSLDTKLDRAVKTIDFPLGNDYQLTTMLNYETSEAVYIIKTPTANYEITDVKF